MKRAASHDRATDLLQKADTSLSCHHTQTAPLHTPFVLAAVELAAVRATTRSCSRGEGKGEEFLSRFTAACGVLRRALRCCGCGDELRDCVGCNEATAAQDDTGELSLTKHLVDGVARNATEAFPRLVDGIQVTILHIDSGTPIR